MFAQALAVLERARPSAREELFFRLLNQMVWGAVGFTALYLVLRLFRVGQSEALPIAWAAAILYIFIIPVLILNWRLIRKLWKMARLQGKLAPSWKSRLMDRFIARRRQRRLVQFPLLILSLVGFLIALAGQLGLFFELLPDQNPTNFPRLGLWVVAILFGASCVFLQFMARGRELLEVVTELKSTLLGSRNAANETQLAAEDYDEITRLERGQIRADRRRSLKEAATISMDNEFSSKENRSVREAKHALVPATVVKVQACIDRLTADPRAQDAIKETRNDITYVRVPDTSLEIGFRIDWEAREIKVLSLDSAGNGQAPTLSGSGHNGKR